MLNTAEIRGHWNVIQGKLKERWGQLTDDDLRIGEGNIDQLIGRIQERVGVERRAVEEAIAQISAQAPSLDEFQAVAKQKVQEVAENVRRGANEAVRHFQENYEEVGQHLQEGLEEANQKFQAGYRTANKLVRRRPVESVATTFLAGVITGLFVAMITRSDRS
jgi:uncharacterized protein YjbJ (UPF0337 family)